MSIEKCNRGRFKHCLLEDSIKQEQSLSLPKAIKRYKDVITGTKSRLNYAIAPDLYMMPANMILKVGTVQCYNNNLTVATRGMVFGINDGVDSERLHPKMAPVLAGKPSKVMRVVDSPTPPVAKHLTPQPPPTEPVQSHFDNKTYLVLVLGALVG
jgi:hypothetical protein